MCCMMILSSFILVVDLKYFNLKDVEAFNVESINKEEDVHVIDDFIDNKVQYDDTMEDYMNDKQDIEDESDDT